MLSEVVASLVPAGRLDHNTHLAPTNGRTWEVPFNE